MAATSDIVFDCLSSNALFSGGIPTSVVCQKDALIIAVTSVFFVLSIFSDGREQGFLAVANFECRGEMFTSSYALPPYFRSPGIIDLEKNYCQVYGE